MIQRAEMILKWYSIKTVICVFSETVTGSATQHGQQEDSQEVWEDLHHPQETFREGETRPGAEARGRVWPEKQERGEEYQ